MRIPPLHKFTPHNLFLKWPRLVAQKFRERLRHSPLRIFLFRKNPVILEDYYGIRFILYPHDDHVSLDKLITRRNYRDEFAALANLVKRGNTIFDVGANIGLHATLFSRWAGPMGRVFAFEPVPETYWLLQETLSLNRCANVIAVHEALGNLQGNATMNLFPQQHSVWNTFGFPNFNGLTPTHSVNVMTDTLDHFCMTRHIEHIDFMKVDVEGFEKQVFDGAREMLKHNKIKALSFEVSQIPLQGMNACAKDLFDLLHAYEYSIYLYNPSVVSFEGPVRWSDEFYENYYASIYDLTKIT